MTTTHIDINDIDTLTAVAVAKITTRQMREGMILVDEFDMPVFVLDHRIGTKHGCAEWMVADLDRGHWRTLTFPIWTNPNVRVAADIRRVDVA